MGQQKEDCVSPNDEEEREADSGQQDSSEEGVESDDVDSDATSISSSELVSISGRSSEFRCHSADYQLDQMPDGHGDEASGDERFGWNAYDKQAASLSGAYNQEYSRSVFRDSLAMRSAQLPWYPVTSLSQVNKEGCKDSASENLVPSTQVEPTEVLVPSPCHPASHVSQPARDEPPSLLPLAVHSTSDLPGGDTHGTRSCQPTVSHTPQPQLILHQLPPEVSLHQPQIPQVGTVHARHTMIKDRRQGASSAVHSQTTSQIGCRSKSNTQTTTTITSATVTPAGSLSDACFVWQPMVKYEQPYKVAGLAQQSAPIQDVIRAAIKVILKDLLINGQRVTTEKQAQHQRSLILGCIEEIRKQNKKPGDDAVYKEIHVRVSKDTGYAKTAIVLCKRRCKNMRCDIKQACAGLIAREYGLAGLTARNIKKNLMTDLKYIYSGSPKNPDTSRPFERPIFSSAIKRIISNNRYGGIKYCSDFPVSPQGDKEIPAPFLAYIAGGITASLKAYIRNGRKIHSTLETVIFEDEYYKALKFIEEIREEKPTEYTDMMTQLFNDASSN